MYAPLWLANIHDPLASILLIPRAASARGVRTVRPSYLSIPGLYMARAEAPLTDVGSEDYPYTQ